MTNYYFPIIYIVPLISVDSQASPRLYIAAEIRPESRKNLLYTYVGNKSEHTYIGTNSEHTYVGTNSEHTYVGTNSEHTYVGSNWEHTFVNSNREHTYVNSNWEQTYVCSNSEHTYVGSNSEHICVGTNSEYTYVGSNSEHTFVGTNSEHTCVGDAHTSTNELQHDKTNIDLCIRPVWSECLGIRPVWSETSLSTWRSIGSLVPIKQRQRSFGMPRQIWAFTGRTGHFVGFVMLRLSLSSGFSVTVGHISSATSLALLLD